MRVLAVLLILFTTAARASDGSLLSTHLMLPVTISGNELPLESFVVRPDHPGRFPLVLVTHGTPGVDGDAFFREILNRSPVGYSKAAVAFCSARLCGRLDHAPWLRPIGRRLFRVVAEGLRLSPRRARFRRGCHRGGHLIAEGTLG